MKGNDKIIDRLNARLAEELSAVNQYMVHAEMADNWGYERLHGIVQKRAVDEMKHAERLISRMLFLEGRPIVSQLVKIEIGAQVEDQLAKDWAAENGAKVLPTKIYLEDPGGRRYESWKNLDIRLEKEFLKAGRRTFSISVDVLNLLGDKYRTLDLNDGGTWRPDGEGSSTGTRTLSGTYNTYWPEWGSRVIRFNFKLGF